MSSSLQRFTIALLVALCAACGAQRGEGYNTLHADPTEAAQARAQGPDAHWPRHWEAETEQ
jgi:hypothetical protein